MKNNTESACWHIWDANWNRHCCDLDENHTGKHHCICGEKTEE